MSEQKVTDKRQFKYEDIIDIEAELSNRKKLVEIALGDLDKSWKVHNTKDDNVEVVYCGAKSEVSDSGTSRGTTTFKGGDMDCHYKYHTCGYDDAFNNWKKHDKNITEARIHAFVDKDHQIVYTASKSGFLGVSPRDFTYMATRFKMDNFEFNGQKYKKLVADMGYSIPENHPFNVAVKKNHVRATIIISGWVLYQPEGFDDDTFKVCYILSMDAGGLIPQFVASQFAPEQGMTVKIFPEHYKYTLEVIKERDANNWQTQRTAMFERHPKLMYIEQKAEDTASEETKEAENVTILMSKEYTFKKYTFRSRIICLDDEFDDIIFQLPKKNKALMEKIKKVVKDGDDLKKDVKIVVSTIMRNDEEDEIITDAKIE